MTHTITSIGIFNYSVFIVIVVAIVFAILLSFFREV